MRKFVYAGLALATTACAAAAADLGPYPPPSGYSPPASYGARPFSWSGFYVGAQAGYGWGDTTSYSGPWSSGFTQDYTYSSSGFLGGLHAGFNWQANTLVIGAETDIEGSWMSGEGIGRLGSLHSTSVDWLGSVRGRLGLAMGNTMLYGTAGLAYGDVTVDRSIGGGAIGTTVSDWRTGWTAGLGLEHAFSSNLTARLEYRYTDLGVYEYSSPALNTVDRSDVTFSTIRAGLSYKF